MPIARTISHNGTHTKPKSHNGTQTRSKNIEGSKSYLDGSEFKKPRMNGSPEPSGRFPGWVPWALGGAAVCAICYGLSQIDSVRDFFSRTAEPIQEFISGDEFEENEYVPHPYEDESDFGSGDFGSSASQRFRSQL